MDLLKFLDARLGEPSTWAGIAALLAAVHVNVSPGAMMQLTLWGGVASAVLAVVLAEVDKKSGGQVAADAAAALVAAIKSLPDAPKAGAMALLTAGVAALALSACTAQQQADFQAGAQRVVAQGQLFCAKATATGPLVVALANAAGAPVIVTGLASTAVAADCAAIDAIPVAPPANPAAAPVVVAPVAAANPQGVS